VRARYVLSTCEDTIKVDVTGRGIGEHHAERLFSYLFTATSEVTVLCCDGVWRNGGVT
jgi:hypothetical protein